MQKIYFCEIFQVSTQLGPNWLICLLATESVDTGDMNTSEEHMMGDEKICRPARGVILKVYCNKFFDLMENDWNKITLLAGYQHLLWNNWKGLCPHFLFYSFLVSGHWTAFKSLSELRHHIQNIGHLGIVGKYGTCFVVAHSQSLLLCIHLSVLSR